MVDRSELSSHQQQRTKVIRILIFPPHRSDRLQGARPHQDLAVAHHDPGVRHRPDVQSEQPDGDQRTVIVLRIDHRSRVYKSR